MELTWRVIREREGNEWKKKVQGIGSMLGRYKIDRGMLRIV